MGVGAVTHMREDAALANLIASLTRDVADFPKPGVQFKDLTPVFADAKAMAAVTDAVAALASGVQGAASGAYAATAARTMTLTARGVEILFFSNGSSMSCGPPGEPFLINWVNKLHKVIA